MIKVVAELAAAIPPPKSPKITIDSHDKMIELFEVFGTRLPEDFLQFHRTYGEGYFFSVTHKSSANLIIYGNNYKPGRAWTALRQAAPTRLNVLRRIKESRPKRVPFPLFCEPKGLLPWANTTNDLDLCWRVHGELVDNWTVVVLRAGTGENEEFDCGMAEFLTGIISGKLACNMLPKGFPGTRGVGWAVWGTDEETFSRTVS